VEIPWFLALLCVAPVAITALAGVLMLLGAGPMWEGRLGQFWIALGGLLSGLAFAVARLPKVSLVGRCLVAGLFTVVGYGALGGVFVAMGGLESEPPPAWREYSSPSAGFRVLMPGAPQRKTEMAATPDGPRPQNQLSVERSRGKALFVVLHNELTGEERTRSPEVLLDDIRKAVIEESGGQQQLTEQPLRLAGSVGRELLLEGTRKGTVRWRFYVAKGRLYQLIATYPAGAGYADDAARFLDSFQLVEAPPDPDNHAPDPGPANPPPPSAPFEGHAGGIAWMDVSPKDQVATSSSDRTVKLWDLLTGKEQGSLPEQAAGVGRLIFAPDGKTLAVAGHNESRVLIWDLATRQQKQSLPPGPKGVTALAYSPDGKYLAVAHFEQVKLWEAGTGKEAGRFEHLDGIVGLAFSPDGSTLYQLGGGGVVHPVAMTTRREGKPWNPGDTGGFVTTCLALSKDGKLLAAAAFDQVRFWDTGATRLRTDIRLTAKQVGHVALSPDGKLLATVSQTVTIWDLEKSQELATIEAGHQADQAVFSADGARLVLRVYGKIKVYEVAKVLAEKRVP
jgi:DNA-binding beta-propeller fold protein YncE